MRLTPVLILALVLVAGCASKPAPATPTVTDTGTGPIDLTSRLGLLAIDLTTRQITTLTQKNGLAWMSPSGSLVVWQDATFSVLLHTQDGTRDVVPTTQWTRIYDNVTGLDIIPGRAVWRDIKTGVEGTKATLPDAPRAGTAWTTASEDLQTLGAEYQGRAGCGNDLFIHAATNARSTGCHLRVADDGRVGWTENGVVRVRGRDGTVTNVTPPPSGDAAAGNYVARENPVFTANGVTYLELTGGSTLASTKVITSAGDTIASLAGARRVALVDASDDGRFLLLRTFDRP